VEDNAKETATMVFEELETTEKSLWKGRRPG
jgi:hypothetical protein